MRIGTCDLTKQVMIVAEIGNNHEGSLQRAQDMIGAAARAGADAVKFQTIVPEKLVSADQHDRIDQLRRLCLSYEAFRTLKETADKEQVVFLSTPFDLESARFLNDLVPAFKIASGDLDFFPLLEAVAETGKPVLLSTGLATYEEISRALARIKRVWDVRGLTQEVAVLHCVARYPTPPEQANLRCISTLHHFGIVVGYSDHTVGIDAVPAAVALGARIVEKHFTLDKKQSAFRDHALSATPDEFAEMVRRVRAVCLMLGDGRREAQPCEVDARTQIRRSIAARHALRKGHHLDQGDLMWVRPQRGLKAGEEQLLLGRKLTRDIPAGTLLTLDLVA